MRTVSVLVATTALAAMLAGTAQGRSGGRVDPAQLTLRLPDLPRGYLVGDDSGCGPVGVEGASDRFARLVLAYRPTGCVRQFERLWVARPGSPPLVESTVIVFQGTDGARELVAVAEELVAFVTGLRGFTGVTPPALGEQARAFATTNAVVAGRLGRPGYALVWRSGSAVGLLYAAGLPQAALRPSALALARTQQRRIEQPSPVRAADFDDLEVPLDHPKLGVPPLWLGRFFDPPGSLPPVRLSEVIGPLGPGGGPGNALQLSYDAPGHAYGIRLYLWKPAAWQRFRTTRLGRLVWDSPCARTTRTRVRGRLTIVTTGYWSTPKRRPCPTRPYDYTFGHVHLRGVVVAIDMPFCFMCGPMARVRDPYASRRGIEAVARALRVRPRR